MRELVRNIEKIEHSVSLLVDRMGGLEKSVPTTLDKAKEKAGELNDGLEATTDHLKAMSDLAEESFSKWQKWGQSLTGIFEGVGGAISKAGGIMRELQNNPSGYLTSTVGQIPYVGPMLEVALKSQFRQSEFEKQGRQSALAFQGNQNLTESGVRATGAALGEQMRNIEEKWLGKSEDVKAVWEAFAKGGVKSTEIMKQASFEIEGFGKTISEVALGVDKAFGMTAGSTAELSNQIRQSSNASLSESVDLVKNLGLASQGTGQTMQAFIGTVLQATSALRVQGGDARDLANTYFKLQETIKTTAAPGTSGQRISALTGSALGGLSQFVQGMPIGLQALVGQDMSEKMGLKLTDIGSLRAFETGFQGHGGMKDNEDFSKKAAEAAYARLKSEGVTEGDDMYMALKSMGMSAQLADLLDRAKGNLTGPGADKAAKEYEDKLKEVAKLQPLTVGDLDRVMGDVQKLMMSIGQMTLNLLGTIAQTLISMARATFDSTYTHEDAMRDISGRAGRLADEGKRFGELSKRLGVDTGDALDVSGYFRQGSKVGQASISEQLVQQAALGLAGPAAPILQLLNLARNNLGGDEGGGSGAGGGGSGAGAVNGYLAGQAPFDIQGLQSKVQTKDGWLKLYLEPRVEFEPNRDIPRGDTPDQ